MSALNFDEDEQYGGKQYIEVQRTLRTVSSLVASMTVGRDRQIKRLGEQRAIRRTVSLDLITRDDQQAERGVVGQSAPNDGRKSADSP